MRVALIGDYPLNPDRIRGGEQAAFAYLVGALCRTGRVQVHILTLGPDASAGQTLARDDGSTLHVLPPLPHFELYRGYPNYKRSVRRVLTRIAPDVVHAQGDAHHGSVALASGFPTVLTVHGVQKEDAGHHGSLRLRLRKRLVAALQERPNLQRVRYLIAISRYVTDYFAAVLNPGVRVYYIANAIKQDFFELGKPPPGHTVLFAGRVIRRKRVLDLVRAFRTVATHLPGVRLRIAGECESEPDYARRVLHFADSRCPKDSVAILGALSEPEILQEYERCHVLILSSGQENSPMVVAQAMAAARPVVATRVGGVGEMVADDQTGRLVEVGDVEGLAAAMRAVLEDPSGQLRMGENGRREAETRYRASAVANQTCRVYEEMIAGGP